VPVWGIEVRPKLNEDGDQVQHWLSVSAEPVNVDGVKHVVVALNDVTDRKRAEEELRETMEMKSQFISTVSHELRTPMTAMREAVIIVLDEIAGRLNEDQKHFLDIAKRNIDRLSRLIDDVLDFQKLNAGKMKFHLQANDIAAAVREAYATMQPHAAKSRVDLAIEVEPNLPAAFYDGDRIMQALTNLISNAIKFTPEGGRVLVSAHRREEQLVIQVSDTGYGIPKEDLPKLFSQFFRVHRPGKEIKGTGLGLAIVSKIVAGHGGRIEVESELNKGTTFTVFLPLTLQPAEEETSEGIDRRLENMLTGQ
jgi:signal transduction histidine kinase